MAMNIAWFAMVLTGATIAVLVAIKEVSMATTIILVSALDGRHSATTDKM